MFIVQIKDANEVKNQEIAKELSLPPVKLHCSSKLGGCNQRIMKKIYLINLLYLRHLKIVTVIFELLVISEV